MRKHYYIKFLPEANVNYFYLFDLMDLAYYQRGKDAIINYDTKKALAESCSFSVSTFNRMSNIYKEDYLPFLDIDTDSKRITIHSNFSNSKNVPFVCLTDKEVSFLRKYKEQKKRNYNLLCKYLMYCKYYATLKESDYTIKQFLHACGLDKDNNATSYESVVAGFNTLLADSGFITIRRVRDSLGHIRNFYRYNQQTI